MVQAHVIRFIPPFNAEEVSTPHYHDVDFQMIYVLKGWIKSEFEGEGVHTFHAGSCWIQPPRIKHTVLGYSDDCEVLEIVLPADFETVTLANCVPGAGIEDPDLFRSDERRLADRRLDIVVRQHAQRGAFDVAVLPAAQGPQEPEQADQAQAQRHRHEIDQHVHEPPSLRGARAAHSASP